MAKRKKGPRRRRSGPITRRDLEAKRARRETQKRDEADSSEEEDDAEQDEDDEDEAPDDDAADDEAPDDEDSEDGEVAAAPPPEPEPREGAAWAEPILRLEKKWTWLEVRVLFVALIALTLVLCFWIVMRGMKEPLEATEPAGTLFRAIVGAAVLGGLARRLTRGRLEETKRNWATAGGMVLGIATAKLWRGVGIDYFANLYDWLQEGSAVTLMGGLSGVSTRLAMTVALIGGSLAAATGAHINIDVVLRLIPQRFRHTVHVLSAFATFIVCMFAAWGLYDFVVVTQYKANADLPASAKVGHMTGEMGEQFFLWRKQMKLDFGAIPKLATGRKWSADRMNGREWNEYLATEGFVERYGEEKVADVRAPESALDEPWTPFVVAPGGDARGALMPAMDLIFPFGFFMIGLRFLLRALLLLGRHLRVEDELASESVRPEEAS